MIPSLDSMLDCLFLGFAPVAPATATPTKEMFATEQRYSDYLDATEDTTIYDKY